MGQPLSDEVVRRENRRYRGTGGRSEENAGHRFLPAFLDSASGQISRSRFGDGRPAPFHLLDGLPDEFVLARSATGRVVAVKPGVVSGFVRGGQFYTRDAAAAAAVGPVALH